MKIRKKRKKDNKLYKYNVRKSILILSMLICIIVAMITYWIYAYHHKYGNFYNDDVRLVSYKVSDYVDIKGDMVYLKNMDSGIISYFDSKQESIMNNDNLVSTDIINGLYDGILSIMVNYTILGDNGNYEEILTLNVNLRENKVLSDIEVLDMIGSSYKNIATSIFNEYIKLPSDYSNVIVDAISDKEISASEFNENSEKYIIRIREKLPDVMKLYIEDNKVYYVVRLSEIDKVCYYTNKDNRLVNINKEIGKI